MGLLYLLLLFFFGRTSFFRPYDSQIHIDQLNTHSWYSRR